MCISPYLFGISFPSHVILALTLLPSEGGRYVTSYVPSPLSRTSGVSVPDKQNMFPLALSNSLSRVMSC